MAKDDQLRSHHKRSLGLRGTEEGTYYKCDGHACDRLPFLAAIASRALRFYFGIRDVDGHVVDAEARPGSAVYGEEGVVAHLERPENLVRHCTCDVCDQAAGSDVRTRLILFLSFELRLVA